MAKLKYQKSRQKTDYLLKMVRPIVDKSTYKGKLDDNAINAILDALADAQVNQETYQRKLTSKSNDAMINELSKRLLASFTAQQEQLDSSSKNIASAAKDSSKQLEDLEKLIKDLQKAILENISPNGKLSLQPNSTATGAEADQENQTAISSEAASGAILSKKIDEIKEVLIDSKDKQDAQQKQLQQINTKISVTGQSLGKNVPSNTASVGLNSIGKSNAKSISSMASQNMTVINGLFNIKKIGIPDRLSMSISRALSKTSALSKSASVGMNSASASSISDNVVNRLNKTIGKVLLKPITKAVSTATKPLTKTLGVIKDQVGSIFSSLSSLGIVIKAKIALIAVGIASAVSLLTVIGYQIYKFIDYIVEWIIYGYERLRDWWELDPTIKQIREEAVEHGGYWGYLWDKIGSFFDATHAWFISNIWYPIKNGLWIPVPTFGEPKGTTVLRSEFLGEIFDKISGTHIVRWYPFLNKTYNANDEEGHAKADDLVEYELHRDIYDRNLLEGKTFSELQKLGMFIRKYGPDSEEVKKRRDDLELEYLKRHKITSEKQTSLKKAIVDEINRKYQPKSISPDQWSNGSAEFRSAFTPKNERQVWRLKGQLNQLLEKQKQLQSSFEEKSKSIAPKGFLGLDDINDRFKDRVKAEQLDTQIKMLKERIELGEERLKAEKAVKNQMKKREKTNDALNRIKSTVDKVSNDPQLFGRGIYSGFLTAHDKLTDEQKQKIGEVVLNGGSSQFGLGPNLNPDEERFYRQFQEFEAEIKAKQERQEEQEAKDREEDNKAIEEQNKVLSEVKNNVSYIRQAMNNPQFSTVFLPYGHREDQMQWNA